VCSASEAVEWKREGSLLPHCVGMSRVSLSPAIFRHGSESLLSFHVIIEPVLPPLVIKSMSSV
jgi:hypothetical protein